MARNPDNEIKGSCCNGNVISLKITHLQRSDGLSVLHVRGLLAGKAGLLGTNEEGHSRVFHAQTWVLFKVLSFWFVTTLVACRDITE
jgi:hypothetical protein